MVKGVSKQVVVVRSPDGEIFEQALFILNENEKTMDKEQVLGLATAIADKYLKTGKSNITNKNYNAFKNKAKYFLLGVGISTIFWYIINTLWIR